jgi:hypothetical protein
MNTELIQSYIAFKAPSPRNMLILLDKAKILLANGTINVLDRDFDIVNYDSDLQIRDMLEEYKDDMQGKRFCIISSKDDEENLMISDYIARSSCIEITPQFLLEYSQNGYAWFENVNQLEGQDFWDNFDKLQKFRSIFSGHVSQSEYESVILSALLNVDFSKPLLPAEAVELQRKLDRDEKIAEFRIKYPQLMESLERKVHDAIPLMAKIGSDDDLAKFLWLAYSLSQHSENYELLLPRILGHDIWQKYGEIPLERAEEICEQLNDRDPSRSMSQIKVVEEWLNQDEERMRLFKGWLGVSSGNVIKAAEYSASEKCFCAPLKDALRTVARAMVSSSVSMVITQQLMSEILKNITVKHIFLQDDSGYLRLQDTFKAFSSLCEFLNLISEIKRKEWWHNKNQREDINLWLQEIYPKYLSRIELLRDRIETLNFKCDLLSSNLVQKIIDEAKQILSGIGEGFADLIQKYYSLWVMEIEKRPILTTDFISQVFQPLFDKYIKEDNQSAFIIVFDGMRWDEWELLKPMILKTFHGKLAMEDIIPLIAILPSTTEWARNALFAGTFPRNFQSADESELFSLALGTQEIVQIRTYGEAPGQRDNILRFLEDPSQIKPIVFNLIDIKIHSTMQNLVTLYEEVQVNFENTIQPYLEKIPSNSLVFILSDHGFVELIGKGIIAPDRNQADPHRRYIGLRSFNNPNNISSSDFIFFSTENIKMPSENNILKYAFARSGKFITSAKEQESGRTVRYAHGGVSMQEMIIPCAIFVPKSQGQLTMF